MKLVLFTLIFIFVLNANARIEVAFLEAWSRNGKKVELEKGDRFAHVAIKYDGLWLHAAPRNGTELVSEINVFPKDEITEILVDDSAADLTDQEVRMLIGTPYDFHFRWDDTYGTYCSKLVAKLLNIQPQPMKFDGSYFNGIKNLPVGEPGISPDGVYRELKLRGYSSHRVFHEKN